MSPGRLQPTSLPRRALMARVRRKDTAPELEVRRCLHAAGFRYRLYAKDLPGTPDLVFRRLGVAIFVHGCFWHGHDCAHGRVASKSNADFWKTKIEANRARDARKNRELRELGWRVLEIWECRIRKGDWLPEVVYALRAAERRV